MWTVNISELHDSIRASRPLQTYYYTIRYYTSTVYILIEPRLFCFWVGQSVSNILSYYAKRSTIWQIDLIGACAPSVFETAYHSTLSKATYSGCMMTKAHSRNSYWKLIASSGRTLCGFSCSYKCLQMTAFCCYHVLFCRSFPDAFEWAFNYHEVQDALGNLVWSSVSVCFIPLICSSSFAEGSK